MTVRLAHGERTAGNSYFIKQQKKHVAAVAPGAHTPVALDL
jgi:hypothetical protein